jgi:hypothetical protein
MKNKIKKYFLQFAFIQQIVKYFVDKKWNRTLAEILSDVPEDRKLIVKTLVDNQRRYDKDAIHSTKEKYGQNIADIFNIVKRIYSKTLLNDLVGIQPMTGPVGLVFFLRYGSVDNGFVSKPAELRDHAVQLENVVQLNVEKGSVAANTRRFQTTWNSEVPKDLMALHGVNALKEFTESVSTELQYEIEAEVISKLIASAEKLNSYDLHDTTRVDETTVQRFLIEINKAAAKIAHNTRRGAGNVVVCNHVIGTLLSLAPNFVKNENVDDSGFSDTLRHIGSIGKIKILTFSGSIVENQVLVGYRGPNEIDVGFIFSPYVPYVDQGIVVDPAKWEPRKTIATRNGDYSQDNISSYYKVIPIINNTEKTKDDTNV